MGNRWACGPRVQRADGRIEGTGEVVACLLACLPGSATALNRCWAIAGSAVGQPSMQPTAELDELSATDATSCGVQRCRCCGCGHAVTALYPRALPHLHPAVGAGWGGARVECRAPHPVATQWRLTQW
eukprot:359489-Chlamydomonas_euryale.AAC.1